MSRTRVPAFALLLTWVCFPAARSSATFLETTGLSARASAMGGAHTAAVDGPEAWYYNPGGLARLESAAVAPSLTRARLSFAEQRSAGMSSDDATAALFDVALPVALPTGIEGLWVGLGSGVAWGGAESWSSTEGELRFSGRRSSLIVYSLAPSIAYRIGRSGFHLGLAANVSALTGFDLAQTLGDGWYGDSARAGRPVASSLGLLDTTDGTPDGTLSLSTDDEVPTGLSPADHLDADFEHVGFHVGILWDDGESPFSFGFTFRSEVDLGFEGTARLTLAEDIAANPVLGSLGLGESGKARFRYALTLPRQVAFGFAWRPAERLTIAGDAVYTNWAGAWSRQRVRLASGLPLELGDQEIRREFDDTLGLRVGWEYRVNAAVRARAGFRWDPSPVPRATIDAFTFDATTLVYSAGIGFRDVLSAAPDHTPLEGLDLDLFVQVVDRRARTIRAGESVNLGGTKRAGDATDDRDVEVEGLALALGATATYRFE